MSNTLLQQLTNSIGRVLHVENLIHHVLIAPHPIDRQAIPAVVALIVTENGRTSAGRQNRQAERDKRQDPLVFHVICCYFRQEKYQQGILISPPLVLDVNPELTRSRAGCDDKLACRPTATMGLSDRN